MSRDSVRMHGIARCAANAVRGLAGERKTEDSATGEESLYITGENLHFCWTANGQ